MISKVPSIRPDEIEALLANAELRADGATLGGAVGGAVFGGTVVGGEVGGEVVGAEVGGAVADVVVAGTAVVVEAAAVVEVVLATIAGDDAGAVSPEPHADETTARITRTKAGRMVFIRSHRSMRRLMARSINNGLVRHLLDLHFLEPPNHETPGFPWRRRY